MEILATGDEVPSGLRELPIFKEKLSLGSIFSMFPVLKAARLFQSSPRFDAILNKNVGLIESIHDK